MKYSQEEQNKPPNCIIELQKEGVEINEINVGGFFDIYVGGSSDDTGIEQVRFSSDDEQDGAATGEWTDWYDWDYDKEEEGWRAYEKIKDWLFATLGEKELWVEVKDNQGQTDKSNKNILCYTVIVSPCYNQVPFFSQNDPSWKQDHMINENGVDEGTIEQWGCAMTSCAMALQYYGKETNPRDFNKFLNEKKGYAPGSSIYWGKTEEYSENRVELYDIWEFTDDKYQHWRKLHDEIKNGYPVIVKVYSVIGEHHVLVISFTGGDITDPDNYLIHDPAQLYASDRTLAYYHDANTDNTFYKMIIYHGTLNLGVNGIETSSRWSHDPITSLPLYKTFITYTIYNLGPAHAKKFEIEVKANGETLKKEIIDNLNSNEDHEGQVSFNIEHDSGKNVEIIASKGAFVESYNLYINAILPRDLMSEPISLSRVFITPNDPIVRATLNDILNSYPSSMPEWMAIRDWVGTFITYTDDNDEHGQDEYYQLPRETIQTLRGDCEDISILLVSLLRANGWSPEDVYVVIGYKTENGKTIGHGWVRIKIGPIWYNIEPQASVLATLVGDFFALYGFDAAYMFNDIQCERIGYVTKGLSPIDLIVQDPDGLIISKDLNEIPGASYAELDLDGDGELDDQIRIPEKKIGDYLITVIPEPGAKCTRIMI